MDKKDKPISDLHKSLQLLAKKLTFGQDFIVKQRQAENIK